jgi:hypothetical protein
VAKYKTDVPRIFGDLISYQKDRKGFAAIVDIASDIQGCA